MRGIVENYDAGMDPSRRAGGISVDDIYVFGSRDVAADGLPLGTMTYAVPKAGRYRLMILGGGGIGRYNTSNYWSGGGGGGYSEIDVQLAKGAIVTAVLSNSTGSTIAAEGVTIIGGRGADGALFSNAGGAGGIGSGGSINLTGGSGGSGSGSVGTAGAGRYGGPAGALLAGGASGGGAASNSAILPGGRGGTASQPPNTPVNGGGGGAISGFTGAAVGGYPAAAVIYLGP